MDTLNNFVTDAIRTESTIDNVIVSPELLGAVMAINIASGQMLDQIKKHIFYGREYNTTVFQDKFEEIVDALSALNGAHPEHSEEVALTVNPRLFHAIIGMATESTELLEALDFTGEKMDGVNLLEECFDMDWYQFILLDELGADLKQVWKTGFAKLKKRYPEKFTSENALERDLDGERKILETVETNNS